ncbi:SpoIIE family protein phosphatase [Streptomyces bohaiensis]|uniref:SpoIIE family protein phosphatase n=1 Tax=Streptomyces bohaiensis TaxID=1431344 RepID=A0ABX1C466_9ACTN|nr:SpoIIE family protein phosphatase [Streptomyces bohaiensis]NJQ14012.1 SpoIIE family protein phosphatase [Streptomyces bohaiensis]
MAQGACGPLDDPWAEVPDEAATARAILDPAATVTCWNDGARRLLGRPAEEVVGRPVAELLADPEALSRVARAARGKPRWHGTLEVLHRTGRALPVRVIAHRLTDADWGPPGWLVVTPLEGLEATGADADLPRDAFRHAPNALALYDTAVRLRRANLAMEAVLGLREDDIRGLRLSEIGGKRQSMELENQVRQVAEEGRPRDVRTRLRTGGERREHAWMGRLAPIRDAQDHLVAVALSAVDLSTEDEARSRLQLINDAGTRIGTTLEVDRTAQEFADVCVPRLADFVSVDLLQEPRDPGADTDWPAEGHVRLRRIAHCSSTPGTPEAMLPIGAVWDHPMAAGTVHALLSGEAVTVVRGEPGFLAWVAQDPERGRHAADLGVHSILAVPLTSRRKTLGVALLLRYRRPDRFAPDDVLLAREIASRAAVSLDNAQRFTRERDTALALQRSLLPRTLPQLSGVDVAHRYLAASGHSGVGGDWFDVIALSGARVALVVGDVVGHGVQASATMGRLRTAVRTLSDVDLPPDELIAHLDDLVVRLAEETGGGESAGDIGATCLYAVYDPVSGTCSMARAGHPPPVVASPDGATVTTLDVPAGPPLGLGGLPFEAAEFVLAPGSVLALFTDGLVERRQRDVDAGYRALHLALARPADSLDDRCAAVLDALLQNEPPTDDVALLMAATRVLDARHVVTWDVPHEPAACATARRGVAEQLDRWGLSEAAFTTELVVTELLTNAIRHATGPVKLRLILDDTLICEVSDTSATSPHMRRASSFDEGGRGLMLVAQLAQRWGTRHSPTGKTIWAEQQRPDRSGEG